MNKHIVENIHHYLKLRNPEYAVLLSGKWGSGKTYFIDQLVENFLEQYTTGKEENKTKFIKISLFGLSKVTQIDETIFSKLHPILGHKYAKMTGSMLKSALKLGLNFDADGDGKSDRRLTINPKEFGFFSDDKKSDKELIFIFDDLERTSIELSEILGYINYLVEQSKFKVIILANEDEIDDKDDFNKFKEKVIGKTFEVKQDIDATFDTFIEMADNSKQTLQKHKILIHDIFKIANYNNLRHVRQTILDFEYFYSQLDDKFVKHDKIMKKLIYEFFVFSIEIKNGTLNNENFKGELFDQWAYVIYKKHKKTSLEEVVDKYAFYNLDNLLLNIDTWKMILLDGYVKRNIIIDILKNSKYLIDKETESWRRLWRYRELEDDVFKNYLKEVVENFNDNKYKEQGKLLHVIALLLYFSKSKMYDQTQRNIIKQAKSNIKSCVKSEKWDTIVYSNSYDASAYGLVFYDSKSNNMQEILKYFRKEIEKSFSVQLKDKAKKLLEDFKKNNIENLEKKLQQEFYEIPIFSQTSTNDFVLMLQDIEHKNIYDMVQKIKKRYSSTYNLENILSEEKFWKSVNNRILKGISINDNPVKYNLLKFFKEYTIKEILETFKIERERLEMKKTQYNGN